MDIHVLIVEDNHDHGMTLKMVLESRTEQHYVVEWVKTLKDALMRLHISNDAYVKYEAMLKTDGTDTALVTEYKDKIIQALLLDLTLPDGAVWK